MAKTLLVETLVECEELHRLYGALPAAAATSSVAERISDCEAILDYLRRRFAELNQSAPPVECEVIDLQAMCAELARMNDSALLRHGSVLKYICAVEASLADMPLGECRARLNEARKEWRKRFGGSVIAESV